MWTLRAECPDLEKKSSDGDILVSPPRGPKSLQERIALTRASSDEVRCEMPANRETTHMMMISEILVEVPLHFRFSTASITQVKVCPDGESSCLRHVCPTAPTGAMAARWHEAGAQNARCESVPRQVQQLFFFEGDLLTEGKRARGSTQLESEKTNKRGNVNRRPKEGGGKGEETHCTCTRQMKLKSSSGQTECLRNAATCCGVVWRSQQ